MPVDHPFLRGGVVARRLLRSPLLFWAVAAVLATLTAGTVVRFVEGSRAEAARYGPLSALVVATEPVGMGETVRAGQVVLRLVPQGTLPTGHLADIADAVGRTVVVPLLPGVAVVAAHLAPEGRTGVAALLPAGRRALAIPLDMAAPPLRPGDHVDVVATFDPGRPAPFEPSPAPAVPARTRPAGPGEPTAALGGWPDDAPDEGETISSFLVATAVPVLHVAADPGAEPETAPRAVTVAVDPVEARRVAFAITHGVVTLALTAPPAPG